MNETFKTFGEVYFGNIFEPLVIALISGIVIYIGFWLYKGYISKDIRD